MLIKNHLLLQPHSDVDVTPPPSPNKKQDRENGLEKERKHGSHFNSECPLNTSLPLGEYLGFLLSTGHIPLATMVVAYTEKSCYSVTVLASFNAIYQLEIRRRANSVGAASSLCTSSSPPAHHSVGLLPWLQRLCCSMQKGSRSFLWPPTFLLLLHRRGREAGLRPVGCLPADAGREAVPI